MKFTIYKRKVHFYETDAQGIVHHSNYPRYLEEARGFFLEQEGYPYFRIREELGIDIVLLELNVKYRYFLEYGDEFIIKTTVLPENKYYFCFEYEVLKDKKIISTAKTKHCCIRKKDKKLVSVPELLMNIML